LDKCEELMLTIAAHHGLDLNKVFSTEILKPGSHDCMTRAFTTVLSRYPVLGDWFMDMICSVSEAASVNTPDTNQPLCWSKLLRAIKLIKTLLACQWLLGP